MLAFTQALALRAYECRIRTKTAPVTGSNRPCRRLRSGPGQLLVDAIAMVGFSKSITDEAREHSLARSAGKPSATLAPLRRRLQRA